MSEPNEDGFEQGLDAAPERVDDQAGGESEGVLDPDQETGSEGSGGAAAPGPGRGLDLGPISDIPVQVSAVLGKATMPVSQLLRLGRGAVVELDHKVGEPIDILINNRLVARGEVVVVDDHLGVTMTEIIRSES